MKKNASVLVEAGYHWSATVTARRVTRYNIESFLRLMDRTEASYLVASRKPEDSFDYTRKDGGRSFHGFELLHDTGVQRIRVRVEFEDAPRGSLVDDNPVRADLEIEKRGIRHNYYAIDSEVILRVLRYVDGIRQQHATEKEVQDQINELRKKLDMRVVRIVS